MDGSAGTSHVGLRRYQDTTQSTSSADQIAVETLSAFFECAAQADARQPTVLVASSSRSDDRLLIVNDGKRPPITNNHRAEQQSRFLD